MNGAARSRRQAGFSRLELALATVVATLLAAVLLDSLIKARGESELVATKQLIGSLRTALAVRSAEAISTRGEPGLVALAHQNPLDWLIKHPDNYLGEFYNPPKDELTTGNWYFDKAEHALVYLPNIRKTFSGETSKFLVFKVKFVRVPSPVNSVTRNKVTTGLVLDQIPDQAVAVNQLAVSDPLTPLSEK